MHKVGTNSVLSKQNCVIVYNEFIVCLFVSLKDPCPKFYIYFQIVMVRQCSENERDLCTHKIQNIYNVNSVHILQHVILTEGIQIILVNKGVPIQQIFIFLHMYQQFFIIFRLVFSSLRNLYGQNERRLFKRFEEPAIQVILTSLTSHEPVFYQKTPQHYRNPVLIAAFLVVNPEMQSLSFFHIEHCLCVRGCCS